MASLQYEVNRLAQDELVYELAVRGLTEVGTVEQMRKTLRNLLRMERGPNPLSYPAHPFTVAEDLAALTQKAEEIKALVDDFDGISETGRKKILSKLACALGRANTVRSAETVNQSAISKIVVSLLNSNSDMEYKVRHATADQSLGALDVSLLNVDSGEDSDVETSPTAATSFARGDTSFRAPSVPVYKWNLKFSGEDSRLSLSAFLMRVEELRVSRNVTEEELFQSANDLFEGRALTWFRSVRRNAYDWRSLVALLRNQFQPADYNDRLFEEIRRRTQGPDESIAMFAAVMDNMFDRVTVRVPEATRLKIILKNLAPYYQNQLGLSSDHVSRAVARGE
jgi:hypothetical protein